jgi:hypothetical protein
LWRAEQSRAKCLGGADMQVRALTSASERSGSPAVSAPFRG